MGLADFDQTEVVAAVRSRRARTIELLEGLAEPEWETIVVPGWRVREVAAHLITGDAGALNGRMLRLGFKQRPMADIEAWNDTQVGRWADRPIPSLLQALERWGRRIARVLALAPGPVARRRIPTPLGKGSLLWLAGLRVYDEWVHGEDVRRAFGRPSDDGPEAVLPVARQLLATMPFRTLPRISPAATGLVTVRLTDPEIPAVGVDLDERRYGTTIGGGTVVTARSAPLIMVAAGRDAWRDAEAAGAIHIEGDLEPAETLLDALAV